MNIAEGTSLRRVSFIVCTALHRAGIEAVLTGGSAATVHAPDACQSRDLDYVIVFQPARSSGRIVLETLGYRHSRDHYEHPVNSLILEFPPGPLAVGREIITQWDTMREDEMLLHILTPTDCCRDRLAGFLFWNDRGSLDQAVAVARACGERIHMDVIRAWCGEEGRNEAFSEFQRALTAA